jgi:putative Mg2+ transporter-C (MgtC) family protein
MDLMRLLLGILTGIGFLGGGAILKKGGSITGSRPPPPCGSRQL